MNKTQISESLKKYGYAENEWTDLKNITMIFMDHDVRLFPDPETTMFYFDSTTEILKFVYGEKVGKTFKPYDTKPTGQVPYEAIGGFIQTSKIGYIGNILYK